MTRALTRLLATASVGVMLTAGPAAHAQDYAFPDSCTADDIVRYNPECTSSTIEVSVTAQDEVVWARESAYPRAAFDAFIVDVEGYSGTAEEYLDATQEDIESDPGSTFDYQASDSTVIVSIAMSIGLDSEDAGLLGVSSDGELITVELDAGFIAEANTVMVTVPGTMLESNGEIDGSTATWTGADLESLAELSARGEAEPTVDATRWVVAGTVLAAVVVLVALYLLVWRRRPDGTLDPIDLEPEYAGDDHGQGGDEDNGGDTAMKA